MVWESVIKDESLQKSIAAKLIEIEKSLSVSDVNYDDYALIGNSGGKILFYSYLNKYFAEPAFSEKLETNLVSCFENDSADGYLKYSTGTLGVLYLLEHLRTNHVIDGENLELEIDSTLLKENISHPNFDFLHGTGGIVHYILSNPFIDGKDIIEHWIDNLVSKGVSDDSIIKWFIHYGSKEEEFGECLGLAHGVPNLVILLIRIYEKYQIEKANEVIIKACNNLLSLKNDFNERFIFPNQVVNGQKIGSRLAWCYGDLGCAWAIYHAGKFLKRDEYLEFAIQVFEHNADRRDMKENQISDSAFCHGTVGIAHFYSRIFNETKKEKFRETAEYWYKITMQLARHDDGIAGFKTYSGLDGKLVNDITLLDGVTGIGLSLISSISNIEPKWDACFLLSK